jgi:hypothetical protein
MWNDSFWVGATVGGAVGVLLGVVGLWSFLNPTVGRIVARVVAIGALGFGVGWIVTPIIDLAADRTKVEYHSPLGDGDAAVALGWGAAAFSFGVLALVLSFLRFGNKAAPPKEELRPRPERGLTE